MPTLPFGRFALRHPAFRSGDFDTHFISKYFTPAMLEAQPDPVAADIAAALAAMLYQQAKPATASEGGGNGVAVAAGGSNWRRNRG